MRANTEELLAFIALVALPLRNVVWPGCDARLAASSAVCLKLFVL